MRKLANEEISKLANEEIRELANEEMRKMGCLGDFVANNAK